MARTKRSFTPKAEQMALWPTLSGNTINGQGDTHSVRPKPIYWHDPDRTPHGPLQRWFYAQSMTDPLLGQARAQRQKILDMPLGPLAAEPVAFTPDDAVKLVKQAARDAGADLVGITEMRSEWVFEGFEVKQRWIVMIGVAQDYDAMSTAPEPTAAAEVVRQYGRGTLIAKAVATAIRAQGHDAVPHGGPLAGPLVLIPPAIECGFGELGKHGSIINRKLGSSFRLASVLTDLPLMADRRDVFGADDFCLNCRVCADACPPDAILHAKQMVRGTEKWYVDFDKCLPYFNETMGCGICLVVCPWSRPGVADGLVWKMAQREKRRAERPADHAAGHD